MNVKSKKLQSVLIDAGILVLGGVLFAVAYNMFFLPGEIFIGGAGGIAEVLNLLFGLPTGLMIIAINIPLALLFCIFYGYRSGIKSFIGITVTSLSIDFIKFLPEAFPQPKENAFLCAIFGGISLGAAIGIMLYRGFTTGGSDFVALLIKLKAKKISTAKLIAIVDAIVIIGAAIVMKNFLSVFYSLVSVLVTSLSIEIVTGGFDKSKMAFIFSSKHEEIASAVADKIGRGVTLIEGEGWYTKEKKKIVFCVVKKNEIFLLKTIARSVDPRAFIVLGDSTETIGEGFKENISDSTFKPKELKKKEKKL